jgi:hypothetical protein
MVRTLEACRPALNRVKRSQTPEHIRQRDFLLGVVEELAGLWAKEEDALEDILKDVLSVAELIPLSNEVFLKSFSVKKKYEMGRMDTLVYASVWEHAKAHCQESKVFLNYDKHFNQPGLKRHLQRLNTKLFNDAKNLFMYMKRPRKGVQQ